MTIFRGDGGAGDATSDIEITTIAASTAAAAASAASAATSETNADTSATSAANSASSASSSASSASSSASAASTSASGAATSASNASTSASDASTSATNASTSASTASTQASNAAASATTAASYVPSQTGNSGKFLTTDGTSPSWAAVSGSGTVTSVAATVPSFLSVAGSPITTSGTLDITLSGTALSVANGGTGSTTSTGSGSVVLATSPTLVTPLLGTPTSGNFSTGTFTWPTFNQNTSGTAAGLSATLAVASGGTGVTTSTGSGSVVLGTAPSLDTAVIVATSTTDALRITNTGTGNSLLVEDAANPDSSPFVIDSNGIVLSGLTAASATYSSLYGGGVGGGTPAWQSINRNPAWTAAAVNAQGTQVILAKSRTATPNTGTCVSNGDDLGVILFQGDDGTNFIRAAQILSEVDGTPGTSDMPGKLTFSTTASGSSTPSARMSIDSTGLVALASTSGLSIGRTAVTAPATADGNVFSGTYTPTLTNTTNLTASTASAYQYMRVGNTVTVSGQVPGITMTAAAGASTVLKASLPIASGLTASRQLAGTGVFYTTASRGTAISIYGDVTNDIAEFTWSAPATTASQGFSFQFTYQVI